MRRLTTLLLLVFCGCDRAPAVLYPIETLVALPPEMHQFLTESSWVVTSIDGRPISESLSGVETLIAKHISDAINIALVDSTVNPYSRFRLRGDGTWHVSVGYWLRCKRTRQENARLPVDPKKNSALVSIELSVNGTYIAGVDRQTHAPVLILKTEAHGDGTVAHWNPYSEPEFHCSFVCPAPVTYPAFTEELDWRIFQDAALSKLFSSPLFSTPGDRNVVYTWDLGTSEGTPAEFWSERGYGVSEDIVLDPLVRYEVRLSSQGETDIVFRRTEERTDSQ